MQIGYEYGLSYIRKALWGAEQTELSRLDADAWKELMDLCHMQAVGALVFPLLLSECDVPEQLRMQMKAVCLQTMQQHVKLQHTLTTAWKALTQAGIAPVLMKGAGLAALYPDPQQRAWGDIDLFVGKAQYHPACAAMRKAFPDALKFDEELDHYKHYNLIADGVSMEIHRVSVGLQHPIDERRYARMEREGMTNARTLDVEGLSVRVPEPTFNALFICMHAWEHMITRGACLRQFCDLALLLHHYAGEIDRSLLKRHLKALHMTDVWQLYMYIAAVYLGLPKDEAPFFTEACSARAERLLTDLLAGRMTLPQSSRPAPANRFARKLFTMHERLQNARRIRMYSPAFARHMNAETLLHGLLRLFAKDRHWE